MSKCGCSNKTKEPSKNCPLCRKESDFITYLVVKSVVKENLKKLVVEEKYYTCRNSDCDVVFFNEEEERIYLLQDIDLTSNFDEVTKSKKTNVAEAAMEVVVNSI